MKKLTVNLLGKKSCVPCFLFLFTILVDGVFAGDFELNKASEHMIEITITPRFRAAQSSNGVVLAPSIVFVSGIDKPSAASEIDAGGFPATVIDVNKEQNFVILSVPMANFIPVTLATTQGDSGRLISIVYKDSGKVELKKGSITNTVSEKFNRAGFFDISVSPAVITKTGAGVFNNCGELIGIYDDSISKKIARIQSLDSIKAAVLPITESNDIELVSNKECPSILQKQAARDALEIALKEQLKEKENAIAAAQNSLDEAISAAQDTVKEAAAVDKEKEDAAVQSQLELEKISKEAQRIKAQVEAIAAEKDLLLENVELAEKEKAELDAKFLEASAALEDRSTKLTETSSALAAKSEEADRIAEELVIQKLEEKKRYQILGVIVATLLGIFLILVLRRRVNNENISSDEVEVVGEPLTGREVIIRTDGFTIKISEELLIRERGVILGRSAAECDYVIDSPSISRIHTRVFQRDGIVLVEDLGSANGSILNGSRLNAGQSLALHDNDTLEMADATFEVLFT